MPFRPNPLRGALCSLGCFTLYSLSDITTKFLGSEYNVVQIIFFSGIAGFPLIFLQLIASNEGGSLRPVIPSLTIARMVIVLLNGILVSYAFTALPLSEAYAIFFMMPIFICVLAVPFLGEKIDLPRGLAVLAGLVGVYIVLKPDQVSLSLTHACALGGALLGALYYIIIRKTGMVESRAVIMLYPMLGQVAAMAVVLPFVYVPMTAHHLVLTWLMALEIFGASLLIIAAYRHAPAVVVAPMQYVQIIVATLFGVFYFGEPVDLRSVIGIAVIIAAGLYIILRSNNGRSVQAA